MYLDNDDFLSWMEKLSSKLNEIGKDLKSLVNTSDILEDNEKILDNQDLCFLFKVSKRTLQRYRDKGILPYFKVEERVYYKASDIREFVKKYGSSSRVRWDEDVSEDDV
ncbi:helix-turn-helix domain-containing protein [Dysgonomonas sp. 511]|uniref:helix-turn-helix domain-containing protein n=1 Tax=Dysgonomonas sp. 511 TaxID=2302930 RepID=UPI0013D478EA|nr:helix-turn-helix domain-containing protein [Dysgonomonas sp. 511]NDV79425.1 DNA-binding protein [Dysgonomonas sp. 511]